MTNSNVLLPRSLILSGAPALYCHRDASLVHLTKGRINIGRAVNHAATLLPTDTKTENDEKSSRTGTLINIFHRR